MGKELRETIKEITYRHLKINKSQVFGQNLTGVGWVAGTLPKLFEKDGVIELPMADVAGGGIVTGSALMGKKPTKTSIAGEKQTADWLKNYNIPTSNESNNQNRAKNLLKMKSKNLKSDTDINKKKSLW